MFGLQQKKDWKQHKPHCTTPALAAGEKLSELKKMFEEMKSAGLGPSALPFSWSEVLSKATDPTDADEVEKALMELMDEMFRARGQPTPDDVERQQEQRRASFQGFTAGAVEGLRRGDWCMCISFIAMGHTNEDGTERVDITVCNNDDQTIRAHNHSSGSPTQHDLEFGMYCGMAFPAAASGEPSVPGYVLVAHRWGLETYQAVQPKLAAAGIQCEFESAEAAMISAAEFGNDPDGHNF